MPQSSPNSARLPARFRFAPPLVADLDALVSDIDRPAEAMLSRPGLDLLRLQRRFRGRVMLVSDAPVEQALWVGAVLGLANAVSVLERGAGVAAKAALVIDRFGPKGFDFLGAAAAVAQIGPDAGRHWLLGHDPRLQRALLSAGTTLVQLSDSDRLPLRTLRPARGDGWADADDRVTGRRLADALPPASGMG